MPTPVPIRLLLSDVDGTLVTPDKELTDAAVDAVRRLADAGVAFAVTSGRPPRGMAMLVEPLGITTPLAAFNGGMFVHPDLTVVSTLEVPAGQVAGILELVVGHGLSPWVYSGADWLVLDADGPHVARESATVGFGPSVVTSFDGLGAVAKVVGVGDDHEAVARAEADARSRFGDHVSASRSQPYYLDVTHPQANKGGVVEYLAARLGMPTAAIATIGDMPNDVLMFARGGLSIAMGNATPEVQRAARRVTLANDADGFAHAVEQFVLPAAKPPGPA
jgi:Cof subfamily protein (haloacid dehalogenase superfamily)